MNENEKFWNKKLNDLTVGDTVKLNAVILGAYGAVFGGVIIGAAIKEKYQSFKRKRRDKKMKLVS